MKHVNYIINDDHTIEAIDLTDNNGVIIEENIIKWSENFEDIEKRRVGLDKIGNISISTVFLGLDHSLGMHKEPVLFETMIFENGEELHCRRYTTWEKALAGHAQAAEFVRKGKTRVTPS